MKKPILILLVFSMLLPPFLPSALAESPEPEEFGCGDFRYCLREDGTAEIRGWSGGAGELAIPGELDGNRVTAIAARAFSGVPALASVTIPDSVTIIGDYAFSRCENLSEITIPDGVITIGSASFRDCRNLAGVTLPDSVMEIGPEAFFGCTGLTEIRLSEELWYIGDRAFGCCTGLEKITIPDSVEYAGENPFVQCKRLTEIEVSPKSLGLEMKDGVLFSKGDGRLVCYPCTLAAESYTVPGWTETIGAGAMEGSALKTVTIAEGVTEIGNGAFRGCKNLAGVSLPASVTQIGEDAFDEPGNLAFTAARGSFAGQFCTEHGYRVTWAEDGE